MKRDMNIFYDLGFLFHLLKPPHWLHFPSMFEYLLKNLNCSLRTSARFQNSAMNFTFFFFKASFQI